MGKTVRINLLVSPEEKSALEASARRANVTTSELVRRAIVTYDPDHDLGELKALVDELTGAASRMEKKLDATLEKVAKYEKLMADRAGLKAAAQAELEASGVVWPFELPRKSRRVGVSG